MLTRNRKRREQLNPNADINLINLVDLAFVLLIIFMITAPMLQGGIDVQLPKVGGSPMTADQGLIVSVARDGSVYIGEVKAKNDEEFASLLPTYLRAQGKREVYIKGDQAVPYGRVLTVFDMLKRLDIADVSLVIDPQDERR